jgi:hypothetical protein
MSDTPETDHLEDQLGQAATHSHPILWEHSRKMERERNEALSQIAQAEKRAERFCQERDEAREEAQKSKAYKRVLKETNARLKRERDEAREQAHRFRALHYSHLGINGSASWFRWEEKLDNV